MLEKINAGMKHTLIAIAFCFVFACLSTQIQAEHPSAAGVTWWDVQAVDTMKDSRDLSRAKRDDASYDAVIERQVADIKDVGATHVAIGTPYDGEFIPFMIRWVKAIRKAGLHVWFRGNFAGWEPWFNYPKITREEHLQKLNQFILANPTLFEDGDIFTPCHECETGGPGDPRNTGDVAGFRSFMISNRTVAMDAFTALHKKVYTGYIPTNGDVARLVMDEETTKKLGGVIALDHYVKTEKELARDLEFFQKKTKGTIAIGEIGAPVPDIHGSMTGEQQAAWLDQNLRVLAQNPAVIAVNYWVAQHGSTALWNLDGSPRPGVAVLKKYFRPQTVTVRVMTEFSEPVSDAVVKTERKEQKTDGNGYVTLPVLDRETTATVSATKYADQTITLSLNQSDQQVVMREQKESFILKLKRFLFRYAPFLFTRSL